MDVKEEIKIIFLWGMMGVGKTTTGKKLAKKLGWEFVDLDAQIEATSNASVSDIFQRRGEAAFRKMESSMLKDLIGRTNLVVSVGGGTPINADSNERMLQAGLCIWLTASPAFLASRLNQSDDKSRPLIEGFSGAELVLKLERLLDERAPSYSKAHITVSALNFDSAKLISQNGLTPR